MKKLFGLIFSVLLCGTLFTSFSPSLDGRAVVAADGVMPKGVFAKTVGYLPGDTISVTSLTTKSTVDILVIGSIDSSEGVAILLSPEAAELLGLSKDSNNVVKITKRSGQLDEAVAGTAVIGGVVEGKATEYDEDSMVDVTPQKEEQPAVEETDIEEIEEEAAEEVVENNIEENAAEETEPATPVEEVQPEVTEATEEVSEGETETSEPEQAVSEEQTPAEEALIPEEEVLPEEPEAVENSETVETIEATKEPGVEEPEVTSEAVEDTQVPAEATAPGAEEAPAEEAVEAEAIEAEELSEEVPPAEGISEETLPEEEAEQEAIDIAPVEETSSETVPEDEKIEGDDLGPVEEALCSEESVAEETPSEPETSDDVVSETPYEEESVEADELDALSAPETKAEEKPEVTAEPEIEEGEESYEPIVLVPAESNPPAKSEVKDEVKPVETKPKNEPVKTKPQTKTPKTSLDKYKVKSLKDLKSGKYYVQIAVLSDTVNLKSIVAKYEAQYPITLVPLASGKATQVMIGPLNMDEYGTVLNRFKKDGYKDAFLRKIK